MIPDEVVEQVAQAADIVAIIGEHVRLKKMGGVYRGPCPFHQGTNNNFSVVPKGGYTCFVCHEKGSVFTFVEKRLGLSFPEAVRYVGEKSGIEVKEVRREREGPDPREPLWELNATVSEWFRDILWDSVAGRVAREYLTRRGLGEETARRFGLGFAPRELGLMRNYLHGLGFEDSRQFEAGLLVRRDEQEEPRPRFRDRLIFPILDAAGHTAGFGGRLLGPGEPKYLNSAESPVFSKGRLLYNLSAARAAIRRDDRVLLVEGYFDVVRLVEAGVESVVAPMGTALTDVQAETLTGHAKTIFLLYDSDAAGQRATFRTADALLSRGATVRVVTLPDGEDPDTFVARYGRDALEKLLSSALDVFDRKVQMLERGGWFADVQRKRRALDSLLPTIRATRDSITRDLYLARASVAAGVARDVLARELEAPAPRRHTRDGRPATVPPAQRANALEARPAADAEPDPYRSAVPASASELALLRVMILHPDRAEAVMESLGRLEADLGDAVATPDGEGRVLRDPVFQTLYDALARHGPDAPLEQLAEELDAPALRLLEEIKSEPGAVVDAIRTVDDALIRLRERSMADRLLELDRMTPLAQGEEKDALLREKDVLHRELAALGGRGWKSVRRNVS